MGGRKDTEITSKREQGPLESLLEADKIALSGSWTPDFNFYSTERFRTFGDPRHI